MSERAEPQHQSRTYGSAAGYGAAGFAVVGLTGVVTAIAGARLYGARIVGDFAIAFAPAAAMWVLSTVREQPALVRRLTLLPPRSPQVTGLWLAVFSFSTALTVAVCGAAAGVAYFAFRGLDQLDLYVPALACLAGYICIQNPNFNLDGVLYAYIAGRELFWLHFLTNLSLLSLTVAGGLVLRDVWGLILATYLAEAVGLGLRTVAVRRYMRFRVPRESVREGFRSLPEILRFGLRLAPEGVFSMLSAQSATWILAAYTSVPVVGAFNRAQMLVRRFDDLASRIGQVLFPTLVSRHARNDPAGFDRALLDTARYLSTIGLWIASVGAGGAVAVMSMFGEGFLRAADALALLVVMTPLAYVYAIQVQGLLAVNRPGRASWITAGRMVITVVVGVLATRSTGIEGPAIGLVAGALFAVIVGALLLRPHLSAGAGRLWSRRQRLGLAAACAGGFVTARVLEGALPQPAGLPAVLVAGSAVYLLTLILVGGLNDRDRDRLHSLRRHVPPSLDRLAGRVRPATARATSGAPPLP